MAKPHAITKSKVGHGLYGQHRIKDAADWIKRGLEMRVKSSDVRSIRYVKAAQHLYVRFLSGDLYVYRNVTVQKATSFFNAASFGKAVWALRRAGWKGYKVTGTGFVD